MPGMPPSRFSRATGCISTPRIAFRSGEQPWKIARGDGAAEEKPLRLVALIRSERARLFGGFDAFGDDLQAEIVAQSDDGPHDRRIVRLARHVLDKRAIHLEPIDGEALEIGETR